MDSFITLLFHFVIFVMFSLFSLCSSQQAANSENALVDLVVMLVLAMLPATRHERNSEASCPVEIPGPGMVTNVTT